MSIPNGLFRGCDLTMRCAFAAVWLSICAAPAFAEDVEADVATTVKLLNGEDLTGWKAANMDYWSVEDGAIVGTAGDKPIKGNQFLWSDVPVKDFYLSLQVKQTPYSANAGIQFRSKPHGKGAYGYQADVGKAYWGALYHEHGRKMLAFSSDAEEANIKQDDWNHYEVLAVGHRIWLAINGEITVALRDPHGELEGQIGLQIHGGKPQRIIYKEVTLTHNPPVALIGKTEEELDRLLKDAPKVGVRASSRRPAKPEPVPPAKPSEKDGARSTDQPRLLAAFGSSQATFVKTATAPKDVHVPVPQAEHLLTNPLVLPQDIRPIASPESFALGANETVVFLGGTDMVRMSDTGYIETLLTASFAKQKPRFRNMAWEGDTVYSQFRPRAFYQRSSRFGQVDQRRRTKADVIFVQFGKMESLDAGRSVADFEAAYEKLVTRLQAYSPRVVLLTPVPFEPIGLYESEQAQRQWAARHARLLEFSKAVYRVGRRRCCQVGNVAAEMPPSGERKPTPKLLNANGVLSDAGCRQLAHTIAWQLDLPQRVLDADSNPLREAIIRKNKIWFEYWQPTNWAFLYGDRQKQPSSRRHDNRSVRWFPDEVEAVLPHLEEAEQEVFRLAQGGDDLP